MAQPTTTPPPPNGPLKSPHPIDDRAHTGGAGATALELLRRDGSHETLRLPDVDPYERMVSAFAGTVRSLAPWSRTRTDIVGMARLLDRILAGTG